MRRSGRHFLQIPGPTNTPDRVLRAMAQPTIDHRSAEFADARARGARRPEDGLPDDRAGGRSFRHRAAAPGKRRWSTRCRPATRCSRSRSASSRRLWAEVARRLGLEVEVVPGDWRRGVDPDVVEAKLAGRSRPSHSRPCSSCTTRRRPASPAGCRRSGSAMDRARASGAAARRRGLVAGLDRPAPRRVGDRRHAGGLAEGADAAARPQLQRDQREGARGVARARACRDPTGRWEPMLAANANGFFPYTPSTNLLYGLREALRDAGRGGASERVRAPLPARRSGARGGARLGTRDRCASGRTSTAPW